MNTYLCLGGPQDGQFVTVPHGRDEFRMAVPEESTATPNPTSFAGTTLVATYQVRELGMFGRRLRVAVLTTLTEAEVNEAAWTHLASTQAKAVRNLRLEGRAGL